MSALDTMKILNRVEREFKERIQRKNSWGKNEVMEEYRNTVMDVIDKLNDDPYNTNQTLLG